MVRRYKQSIAAWNAKNEYTRAWNAEDQAGSSTAATVRPSGAPASYRQGRSPPSAPATSRPPPSASSGSRSSGGQPTAPAAPRPAPPAAVRQIAVDKAAEATAKNTGDRRNHNPSVGNYKPMPVKLDKWMQGIDAYDAATATKTAPTDDKAPSADSRTTEMVANLLACSNDPIHMTAMEFYSIGRVLGEGAFGKVKLAVHKLSEEKVAVKIFEKFKIFYFWQQCKYELIMHFLNIPTKIRPFLFCHLALLESLKLLSVA